MTRINTIDVNRLTDQHLMAEYRELPMIMASLRRSLTSQSVQKLVKRIPHKYTLNKGHVLHFYNKGLFLYNRYTDLITELRSRNYNIKPEDRSVDFSVFRNNIVLNNQWTPKPDDHVVNCDRIIERVGQRPTFYRMHGQLIDHMDYINQIKEVYYARTANV